jgi:hypothetical protein
MAYTEDFFDLCDHFGIMFWDEFFQAKPANGLNPLDAQLYLSNVRDNAYISRPPIRKTEWKSAMDSTDFSDYIFKKSV